VLSEAQRQLYLYLGIATKPLQQADSLS